MTSSPQTPSYSPISDYGLISDMHSCALVSKSGSIDWCCFPRFDSPAVFARILDRLKGGYFQLAPEGVRSVHRRYLPGTNVLETTFVTDTGEAVLTDFMPTHPHSGPDEPLEVGALTPQAVDPPAPAPPPRTLRPIAAPPPCRARRRSPCRRCRRRFRDRRRCAGTSVPWSD